MEYLAIPESTEFTESVRKMLPTDPAHADLFNEVTQVLLNNEVFLEKAVNKISNDLGGFCFYPDELTQAEYDALSDDIKSTPKMLFVIRKGE